MQGRNFGTHNIEKLQSYATGRSAVEQEVKSKKSHVRHKAECLGSSLQGTKATMSTFTINLSNCPPDTKGTFSFETGPKCGGPPAGSGVTINMISSSVSGLALLFSTFRLKLSSSVGSVMGIGMVIGGRELIRLPTERFVIGERSILARIIAGDRYDPSRGFGALGGVPVEERSSGHSTTRSTGQMYPPAVHWSSGASL